MTLRAWILRVGALGALGVLTALTGCAGGGEMTAKQKEGVELRRYCEANPEDLERCLGFLGFH